MSVCPEDTMRAIQIMSIQLTSVPSREHFTLDTMTDAFATFETRDLQAPEVRPEKWDVYGHFKIPEGYMLVTGQQSMTKHVISTDLEDTSEIKLCRPQRWFKMVISAIQLTAASLTLSHTGRSDQTPWVCRIRTFYVPSRSDVICQLDLRSLHWGMAMPLCAQNSNNGGGRMTRWSIVRWRRWCTEENQKRGCCSSRFGIHCRMVVN